MKLKYKRCLKTAQAQYTEREYILADTLNAQQKPRLVCLGVLCCLGEKGGSWLLVSSADCFQHFYKPSSSASYTFNIRNHKQNQKSFILDSELAELA